MKTHDKEGALWSVPRLSQLAERLVSPAAREEAALPEPVRQSLLKIGKRIKAGAALAEPSRGLHGKPQGDGVPVLLAGARGTGKTLAASVLARQLNLDLYTVDLSRVVNKYIGETEKNLAQIFDAADKEQAILLFDEADALFGKRGEVRGSHDRYANIEVSYLLQRMESFQGIVILATNRKRDIDEAFLRRIHFVIEFPVPDGAERDA